MYEHELDPVKGWWDERQLTYNAPPYETGGTFQTVLAGQCGHIDATSGAFRLGLPDSAGVCMPLFARANSADNDVRRVEGNISGQASSYDGSNPESLFIGLPLLVATGGYELGTTEFASGTTFAINDILSSDLDNGELDSLTVGGLNEDLADRMGCGIVSQGVKANKHGINMLYFWACPVWPAGQETP
jgi:hypothetical protein